MNFRAKRLLPIISAVLLFTFALSADTIVATFNGVSPGLSNIGFNTPAATGTNTSAGVYNFTQTGGTFGTSIVPTMDSTIWAFCIELQQNISNGQSTTFNVVDLNDGNTSFSGIGNDRANLLRALFAAAFPPTGVMFPNSNVFLGNNVFAAAVQLAVWEIVHETAINFTDVTALTASLNVQAGNATFTSTNGSVHGEANTLLGAAATNYFGNVFAPNMFAMNNNSRQDFVFQIVTPGGEQPIPEPATMGMLGLGLLGLALYRRKRAAQS